MLFVTFRRRGWVRNLFAGSYKYDGVGGFEVDNNGDLLRFAHRVSAPTEPGTYRVQLHYLERSPAVLAKVNPEEAGRPVGVVAETLLSVVEPTNGKEAASMNDTASL